jgi:hypothetical protein
MQFTDHELDLSIDGQSRRVRVKADLIHLLWGEGSGPQTAEGIVTANIELIRTLAGMKAGEGVIEIDEADYEGEEEADDPRSPEEDREVDRRVQDVRDVQKRRVN